MKDDVILGPTGCFPQGKFNPDDEGEIKIALTSDPVKRKVVLNFGKSITWLALDSAQAIHFANALLERAKEVCEDGKVV